MAEYIGQFESLILAIKVDTGLTETMRRELLKELREMADRAIDDLVIDKLRGLGEWS